MALILTRKHEIKAPCHCVNKTKLKLNGKETMEVKNMGKLPGLNPRKSEFCATIYHDIATGFGVRL